MKADRINQARNDLDDRFKEPEPKPPIFTPGFMFLLAVIAGFTYALVKFLVPS